MEKSFTSHGQKLVELLVPKAASSEVLDFQDVMANLTFETICDIAFGVDPGSMDAGLIEGKKIDFLVRFDRVQQNSVQRFILPDPVWRIMRYLNIGHQRELREDAKALTEYVANIVSKRRESGEAETADDLLSMYIRTAKSSGKKYMMDDKYLIDAVLNFMIAGRSFSTFIESVTSNLSPSCRPRYDELHAHKLIQAATHEPRGGGQDASRTQLRCWSWKQCIMGPHSRAALLRCGIQRSPPSLSPSRRRH